MLVSLVEYIKFHEITTDICPPSARVRSKRKLRRSKQELMGVISAGIAVVVEAGQVRLFFVREVVGVSPRMP